MGICVGANLLSILFGGGVEECVEIGAVRLREKKKDALLGNIGGKEVYTLHTLAPTPPKNFEVLAESEKAVQALKKADANIYALLFYPEVRHSDIIERFCALVKL